ncbi:MAG: beta-lactamase family protein [Gemmatimonadetes bacterium]|nr:beta-lactamase family protein [Gemmatimonadota bacterium]
MDTVHAQQAPRGFEAAWDAVVRDYADRLEREGIVGSSLAFYQDGQELAFETRGFADVESGRAVDRETIYHWASITKTFTSIALMQLRDRGLLDLDDPILDYVPELRAVHGPIERVTLRHLMSHSAGFRSGTWPWGGDQPWHPYEPTEWSQLVAMFPYTELEFEPGSRWQYSNPGIIFLGRVIETLTGEDYETYMEKNVLRPLGMRSAYFDRTPYHLLAHRSNNYFIEAGTRTANGVDFDTGITVSNGGLNAPIPDMARYLAFLVGAAPDATAEAVLARSSLEEMWREQIRIGEEDGIEQAMGLGYFLPSFQGHGYVGHTGSQLGFLSFFYLDPATGAATIAVFNTDGRGAEPRAHTRQVLQEVRADLFGRIFPLFREDGQARR